MLLDSRGSLAPCEWEDAIIAAARAIRDCPPSRVNKKTNDSFFGPNIFIIILLFIIILFLVDMGAINPAIVD